MKNSFAFLLLISALGLSSCSELDQLEKVPESEPVASEYQVRLGKTTLRAEECDLETHGPNSGTMCKHGGDGCGRNTVRCAYRAGLQAVLDRFSQADLGIFWSGEFTVDWVNAHYDIFVDLDQLDVTVHPDDIIYDLQNP